MKLQDWNPISLKPPKPGERLLIATKKLIIEGSFRDDKMNPERQWYVGNKDWYIQEPTHWMFLPPHPTKLGLYPCHEGMEWIEVNKVKPRPGMDKDHIVASQFGLVACGKYKAGGKWYRQFKEDQMSNITHWMQLPKNPN